MAEDKSFFRRAREAMVAARTREAQRYIDRAQRIYGCDFGASRKTAKS